MTAVNYGVSKQSGAVGTCRALITDVRALGPRCSLHFYKSSVEIGNDCGYVGAFFPESPRGSVLGQ